MHPVVEDGYRRLVPMRTRRRVAHARVALRRPTAFTRVLPDVLVLGTMRGGTSSLYRYLAAHPHLQASIRKEVEFFDRNHDRGPAWYAAHFPTRGTMERLRRRLDGPVLAFEATPAYLFNPAVPGRVADLLPDARHVVLLRDPADRAISHYRHLRRLGQEPLDLAAAIAAEPGRVDADLAAMRRGELDYTLAVARYAYVARGRYAEQLERWFATVGRERILVLDSADLYTDTARTLARVHDFLGVPRWMPDRFDNHTYAARRDIAPTPATPGDERVRQQLRARLRGDDRRLVELLGWRPSWVDA